MLRFLSAEWLQAFDDALRHAGNLGTQFGETPIRIAQEIVDEAHPVRYVVVLDGNGGRIDADGPGDVTFVSDRQTAAELAQGSLNAQGALTSGKLKLRGEVDRLAAAGAALAQLGDLLDDLRANTDF
jgi:SCP-2 sterol transfer family